jgi:hypothetical protein
MRNSISAFRRPHPRDEFVARLERRHIDLVTRHAEKLSEHHRRVDCRVSAYDAGGHGPGIAEREVKKGASRLST